MDWSLDRVELAVLGTLVVGEAPTPGLVRLLRPDDFSEAWRGSVIVWLRDRSRAPLRSVDGEGLKSLPVWAQADPRRLTQLLEAAGPPAYLPEYVRLLVEASTARAVAGIGVVLHAGALSASRDGDLELLGYSTKVVRTVIADSRMRLARLRSPEGLDRLADYEVGSNAGLAAVRLSADRAVSAMPRTDPVLVAEIERRFIGSLINHPDRALYWTTAIGTAAIVSRPWRAVYDAVGRLAREKRPIDLVTVAAEVRRGSNVHGAGPVHRELQEWVENGVADDPQYWGRRVGVNRLRRAGSAAAASLREAADNPGVAVDDLLDTAEILTLAITNAALIVQPPPPGARRLPQQQPPGAAPSAGAG